MNNGLQVIISPSVWSKVNVWVQHCDGEVSGLGKVTKHGNVLFVTEAYLLDQVSTGSETELDPSAVAKLMTDSMGTDGDLTWWWHSHADMGVFWSGTDHKQIDNLSKNNYVLATVFNKNKDMLSAYKQGGDSYLPDLFVDKIPTEVGVIISKEQTEQLQKLADEKVKKPEPLHIPLPTGRFKYPIGNYHFGYDAASEALLDDDKCAVPSWEHAAFTEFLKEMHMLTPAEAGFAMVNSIYRTEFKTEQLKEAISVRKLKNKSKAGKVCKK